MCNLNDVGTLAELSSSRDLKQFNVCVGEDTYKTSLFLLFKFLFIKQLSKSDGWILIQFPTSLFCINQNVEIHVVTSISNKIGLLL